MKKIFDFLFHVGGVAGRWFGYRLTEIDALHVRLNLSDQFALIESIDAIDQLRSMIEQHRRRSSDVQRSEEFREMIGIQSTDREVRLELVRTAQRQKSVVHRSTHRDLIQFDMNE